MKLLKKITALGLTLAMVASSAAYTFADTVASYTVAAASSESTAVTAAAVTSQEATEEAAEGTVFIELSDSGITVDGSQAGTDDSAAVYTSNDIKYYEDRDTYDSGNTYGEGTDSDKHSESEAEAHTVVNITEPGTYMISGTLSKGQIAVNLGDDAKTDPDAVVTLIFNGADITCTVAPAVIFYKVYECNSEWVAADDAGTTDSYQASADVDTSDAGANVIIADGSVNNITGSHVAKVYKDSTDQDKKYKYDGAFYSKMSMNIDGGEDGDGVLNIIADNEGLDSEMHLTINGGIINIQSQDDGINTNEDGVSVTTINGGTLHIEAGLGKEGDGVDSNGYLVVNGGVVISAAKPQSDSGLDSDFGSYVNGGYVVSTGSTMDWAGSDSEQVTMNLQFSSSQESDEAIIITDTDGNVVFAYDPDKDELAGSNNRGYQGAVISAPELEEGETYYVYVGGDVEGTEVNGLYDADTVTGFTGAVRQQYTGTNVGGGGMGGGFGGQRPDGQGGMGGITQNDDGTVTLPDGSTLTQEEWQTQMEERMQNRQNGGQRPDASGNTSTDQTGTTTDGTTPPALPDGTITDGTQPPALPDGTAPDGTATGTAPSGTAPDGGTGSQQTGTVSAASVEFTMNEKVNAFSGVCDENTDQAESTGFRDVADTDWYYDSVSYVVNKGLFKGTSDTTFEPDSAMSRAMIWTVLARYDGTDTTAASDEKWYEPGRNWAMNKTTGSGEAVSDGTYPDSSITREQLVTMIWRYAGCPEVADQSSLDKFSDASLVSSYAKTAMEWALENGIISGMGNGIISPQSSATRAQVAAIVQRCCENL